MDIMVNKNRGAAGNFDFDSVGDFAVVDIDDTAGVTVLVFDHYKNGRTAAQNARRWLLQGRGYGKHNHVPSPCLKAETDFKDVGTAFQQAVIDGEAKKKPSKCKMVGGLYDSSRDWLRR